jgi:uncharacterized iron-regulated membrane protein
MVGKRPVLVRRGTVLFGLVAAAAGLMAFEFVSGIVLWFVVPSGQGWRSSGTVTAVGLDRHTWIDLHNWAALMLTAVVTVHLALHWKWVARKTRSYLSGRRGAGTGQEAARGV